MPALIGLLALAALPLSSPRPAAVPRRQSALLVPSSLAIRFRDLLARPPLPPPLAMREDARYKVRYGILGGIGELRLTIAEERAEGRIRLVKVGGQGEGAVLGIGRSEKRVTGDFDPAALTSRRWTMARAGGEAVTDVIEQPSAGVLTMVRQRPGAPPSSQRAAFTLPALDPVGLVVRVRVAPPPADHPLQLLMLDGQALYRVTLIAAGRQLVPDLEPAAFGLRVEGRADPIFYDGRDAFDRPRRTFTLWLSDDDARIPLRLTMPIGPGDVVVELVEATRIPRTN